MGEVVLNGPVGRIEGKHFASSDESAPAVLILHPHPLHGGTMNNKVVCAMSRCFKKRGFSVLRFNFRGVGNSKGVFDRGIGEMLDATAALDWLQREHPSATAFWIAGFSFGAWIAMQLLMRRPDVGCFIAVAPPVGVYNFDDFLSPCPTHGLIVHGGTDNTILQTSAWDLCERLNKQPESEVEYAVVDGADHCFTDKLAKFEIILNDYLEDNANSGAPISRSKQDRRRKCSSAERLA